MTLAAGAFAAGGWLARRTDVTATELRWFRPLNHLAPGAFLPVWAFMQVGSLGGALATSAAVAASGHPNVGRRMAAASTLTWVGVKAVKSLVRRGRPADVLQTSRVLGRAQSGLGYPSGHAAVAATLAAVASPQVPPVWRVPLWAIALVVGPTRMYIGAHLPLDVFGGVAFGVAVGTLAR